MTIAEYAAHTGMADSTIRRRIKRGALEAHQVDGRWLIDVNDRTAERTPSQTPTQDDQSELVTQLQSENAHLREQVDRLTHVVALQTQQHGELTKQLPAPRQSFLPRLKSLFQRPSQA